MYCIAAKFIPGSIYKAARAPIAIAAAPIIGAAVRIAALSELEELSVATTPVGFATLVSVRVSPFEVVVITKDELAEAAPLKYVVVSTSVSTSPSSLEECVRTESNDDQR